MTRQRRQAAEGSAGDAGHAAAGSYQLPVTAQGRVRLSDRLRETYLTPDEANADCITQAVGHAVYLWVWSQRESIRVRFPIEGWLATRSYDQSIHRWSVSINRYLAEGPDDPGIPVVDTTRDGRRLVETVVEPVSDAAPPEVVDGDA